MGEPIMVNADSLIQTEDGLVRAGTGFVGTPTRTVVAR